MQTIRVLLIDTKETVKQLLERRLLNADSMKFVVTLVGVKEAKTPIREINEKFDVVLFGEKAPPSAVIDISKTIRFQYHYGLPIFKLTVESEAKLPLKFGQAGVDDMLNVAEMTTPLFTWTFQSIVEQAEVRNKAREYDVLRHRLEHVSEHIGHIIHEINTPLSIMRLTLYHLEKAELSKEKRESFIRLLTDNLEKVDESMGSLRSVKRQLGEDTSTLAKILSSKGVRQAVAAH
ncbi:MAG TPA: hypothetical protein VGR15_01300 [Bacteroidota bacterium]|jgi:signal transduction histidine kinase|nr:hypothetical protein [Bacteroidota bacterium]